MWRLFFWVMADQLSLPSVFGVSLTASGLLIFRTSTLVGFLLGFLGARVFGALVVLGALAVIRFRMPTCGCS